MNQEQFMREFNDTYREQFNDELFDRSNDDTVQAIREVIESCQQDKYYTLKLLSFELIEDYEKIYNTLRKHEESRRRKNNHDPNNYDYINIRDTDMLLIKINWLVRHNGMERQEIDGKTIEVNNPEEVMEVLIALPRFVRKYYFKLAGNYYTTTYQVVDGSTYNNATASQSKVDTVTMKTMFIPIRIFRGFVNIVDIRSKEQIKLIEYQSIIFANTVSVIYYILAAYGLYNTFRFLEINCVTIADEPIIREDYYSFEKNGIYISCPKVCFEDAVVQSLIAAIYNGIRRDTRITDIYDQRFWLINLGICFKNASIDKGLFMLDSLEGVYDIITKKYLHIEPKDKENIYCILRWLIREFSNLRIKDNVDIVTKRIRIGEYIAAVYAEKLNKGIQRISNMGTKVTLNKVKQAIYTTPMYIITALSTPTMANLVSYRDLVSDYDAVVALKYTYKGIAGLGEDGASIQPVYRYVDASHVGILDLDASSNSDPGMSGMINPMTKVYGPEKSFSNYSETNEWRSSYRKLEKQWGKTLKAKPCVSFDTPPEEVPLDHNRDVITSEIVEMSRVKCPLININDPTILYSMGYAQQAKSQIVNDNIKHRDLFTISDDENDFILTMDEDD